MISIQALRKQEQEEQEARRQRELAAQSRVQGFNFEQSREPAPPVKQGVLKFARFLYDS